MKFELLLSHWLRVTNIIYAALSSGVLAAVLAFPEFRRILFQSWLVVTDVFQLFLIIVLFILLSKIAQLNRIRNGWKFETKREPKQKEKGRKNTAAGTAGKNDMEEGLNLTRRPVRP